MAEALALYLDEPETSKQIFPSPNPSIKGNSIVEVSVDPKVAMAMAVRQARVHAGWTQEKAFKMMEMKNPVGAMIKENLN